MNVFKTDELIISKLKKSYKQDIYNIIFSLLMFPFILIISYLYMYILASNFQIEGALPSIEFLINYILNKTSASDKFLIFFALLLDLIFFISTVRTLIIKNNIIENLSKESLEIFSNKVVFINAINVKDEESVSYIEIPISEIVMAECIDCTESQGGKVAIFIKNLFSDPIISNKNNLRTLKIISKRGIFYLSVEKNYSIVNEINALINKATPQQSNKVRICSKCYSIVPNGSDLCPKCGINVKDCL